MLTHDDRKADTQIALRLASANNLHGGERESVFLATLLAMAGHDLRQPLQVITGAHEILARLVHDDHQRLELSRAVLAVTQLNAMLTQLVEATRLHFIARNPHGAVVFLGPLLRGLAAEFTDAAVVKSIDLHIPPASGAVLSHSVLLRGMLRNLLRNAIDYTPPGGRVRVRCRRAGADLRIEVHDSGPGINEDMRSRLFEAFARGDDTRPEGLGLGLFIVKCAADLLQHRIDVSSTLGRGSGFTVIAKTAHRRRASGCLLQSIPARRLPAPRSA